MFQEEYEEEYEEELEEELGIRVEDGKTVIEYANGTLTENGFELKPLYKDPEGMCHWESNDMSMKMEDLNAFLDLIINSKYLSDGLLWGIAVNTWPVISRQLQEAKLSTPIVFFMGEPGTFKTSVARMFLTTGTYKNGLFASSEVPAFMSAAKFKKQIEGIKSSLVLMDDLHEVKGYNSKDRMQNNIDTICRDFYDYRNDSSLLITAENNVNLKFTESFLQRVVFVNFSSMILEDIDEKERYLNYIDSQSDGVLNILTNYQSYLLKLINNGEITADYIKEKRKEKRKESYNDNVNKTARNSDVECIFDISMSTFVNFIFDNSNISEDILDSFKNVYVNSKNKILSDSIFYKMTFEEKIYHCLKHIGSKETLFVTKPKKGELCKNFKPKGESLISIRVCGNKKYDKALKKADEDEDIYDEFLDENNWDIRDDMTCNEAFNVSRSYINHKNDGYDYKALEYTKFHSYCNLSVSSHKFCDNRDMREAYWPTSLCFKKELGMIATLIEDHQKISFIPKIYFREDEHYSLLIVDAEEFIYAIRDIYENECRKYKIKPSYLPRMQIIEALNSLGIIGYTKRAIYNNGESNIGSNYIFNFPNEKVYILKLPKELYEAINSNAEKFPNSEIYKEHEDEIFKMLGTKTDDKLYEVFNNFYKIKFLPK